VVLKSEKDVVIIDVEHITLAMNRSFSSICCCFRFKQRWILFSVGKLDVVISFLGMLQCNLSLEALAFMCNF